MKQNCWNNFGILNVFSPVSNIGIVTVSIPIIVINNNKSIKSKIRSLSFYMHNGDIPFLSSKCTEFTLRLYCSSNPMLSVETTCTGLQTIYVKTVQSAFKEVELFRYFSWFTKIKCMLRQNSFIQ